MNVRLLQLWWIVLIVGVIFVLGSGKKDFWEAILQGNYSYTAPALTSPSDKYELFSAGTTFPVNQSGTTTPAR